MKQLWTGVLAAACLSTSAQATEKMYGVIGAGYSDAKFSQNEPRGGAFHVGLGHQIASQWYVEGGYKRLFDDFEEEFGDFNAGIHLGIVQDEEEIVSVDIHYDYVNKTKAAGEYEFVEKELSAEILRRLKK